MARDSSPIQRADDEVEVAEATLEETVEGAKDETSCAEKASSVSNWHEKSFIMIPTRY